MGIKHKDESVELSRNLEDQLNITPTAFILEEGIESPEEFLKLWNDCHLFIAKGGAYPMLIFADTSGIPSVLHGCVISVCNGYWRPRAGGVQSCLLSFFEHEGVQMGFDLVKQNDGKNIFNVMAQEDGKGDVLGLLPVGETEITAEGQEMITSVLLSLKEYLKIVPVEQTTSH